MSKDDALKLALEALEDTLSGDLTPYQAAKTITAIREALADHIPDATKMIPQTPEQISNFIGSNFAWREHVISDLEPHVDDLYCLTAHDLLSAFSWWAEQPAQQQEPFGYFKAEPFGWTDCAETDDGAIALYERSQPAPVPKAHEQQEPVAWIEHEWSGTGLRHLHFEKREPSVRDEVVNPVWTPLYTPPQPAQQQEWVGLTDEQHTVIWANNLSVESAIYATEKQLKENNK